MMYDVAYYSPNIEDCSAFTFRVKQYKKALISH
jgi:hypothetical protein